MGGHQAAQVFAHGRVVTVGEAVGLVFYGGDGGLQLAESVVVFEVAAHVDGRALVQLVLSGFDGLFEGAALGQFGSGDCASQAWVHGTVFAGGQERCQRPFQTVIGLLRGTVHCRCGYLRVGSRLDGTGRRCAEAAHLQWDGLTAPVSVAELLFKCPVDVAFRVPFGDGVAFVVLPLAAHEPDLHFGEAGVVDVHAQGHDCPVALGGVFVQVIDLATMKEKFAGAGLLVIGDVAVTILGDVDAHEPGLAIADENKAFAQVHRAGAHRFDFSAGEGDAGLECFLDEVVVAGFTICRDRAGPGRCNLLLLFSGQCQCSQSYHSSGSEAVGMDVLLNPRL